MNNIERVSVSVSVSKWYIEEGDYETEHEKKQECIMAIGDSFGGMIKDFERDSGMILEEW